MHLKDTKNIKMMNKYNLITENEKLLVNDTQNYSRLIAAEFEKSRLEPKETRNIERRSQLVAFRKEYEANKKLRTIELKAKAINSLRAFARPLAERFTDRSLVHRDIFKANGDYLLKVAPFFEIDSLYLGEGTPQGCRIHANVKQKYSSGLYVCITGHFWENGITIYEDFDFSVYELEKGQINEVIVNIIDEDINVKQEIKNAKKYLAYVAAAEKKAAELKKACNSKMLDVIKTNL